MGKRITETFVIEGPIEIDWKGRLDVCDPDYHYPSLRDVLQRFLDNGQRVVHVRVHDPNDLDDPPTEGEDG